MVNIWGTFGEHLMNIWWTFGDKCDWIYMCLHINVLAYLHWFDELFTLIWWISEKIYIKKHWFTKKCSKINFPVELRQFKLQDRIFGSRTAFSRSMAGNNFVLFELWSKQVDMVCEFGEYLVYIWCTFSVLFHCISWSTYWKSW